MDTKVFDLTAVRLKKLRTSNNLSHEKLSHELEERYGIKISTDSLKVYEVTNPGSPRYGKIAGMRIEYLLCLADFYNVSADYLLGKTDKPSINTVVRSVEEMTDLSPEAITKLHIDKDTQSNLYIDFLNALIVHDSLDNLASLVYTYLQHLNHKSEKMPLDLTDMGTDAYNLSIDSHVFLKTILTEYFFNIIDNIK